MTNPISLVGNAALTIEPEAIVGQQQHGYLRHLMELINPDQIVSLPAAPSVTAQDIRDICHPEQRKERVALVASRFLGHLTDLGIDIQPQDADLQKQLMQTMKLLVQSEAAAHILSRNPRGSPLTSDTDFTKLLDNLGNFRKTLEGKLSDRGVADSRALDEAFDTLLPHVEVLDRALASDHYEDIRRHDPTIRIGPFTLSSVETNGTSLSRPSLFLNSAQAEGIVAQIGARYELSQAIEPDQIAALAVIRTTGRPK
jgi:hypothetical protein